jgi:DNA-binding MarR family transcriptional regulator
MPSMTNLVARMERMGLVYREPDPADRRATLVDLTVQGRRYYDDLVTARDTFLIQRLSELDSADRQAIAAALPALERLLGKEGH